MSAYQEDLAAALRAALRVQEDEDVPTISAQASARIMANFFSTHQALLVLAEDLLTALEAVDAADHAPGAFDAEGETMWKVRALIAKARGGK